jgi:hypothetical protein
MSSDNKKNRLAVGYVNCKNTMKDGGASLEAMAKVENIMLASIRTLDFLWDSNADKAMDYVLEAILRHMALVASEAVDGDQNKIYIDMITKTH